MKKYKSPLRTIDGKPLDQFTAQAAERILLNRVQEELAQPTGSVKSAAAIWGMRIDHFHDWYKRLTGNSPMSDRERFLKAAERERLKAAAVHPAPQTGSHPGPSPEDSPAAKVFANSEIQAPAIAASQESPVALAPTPDPKLQKAESLFRDTDLSMEEVAQASGFQSVRDMRDAFNGLYEPAPRETASPKTKPEKTTKSATADQVAVADDASPAVDARIAKAKQLLEGNQMSLKEISAELQLNHVYFQQLFKKATGEPAGQYRKRMQEQFAVEVRRHLDNPGLTLKEVAALFHMTPTNFGMKYEDATGETPRRYLQRTAAKETKVVAPKEKENKAEKKSLKEAHDNATAQAAEPEKTVPGHSPLPASLESIQIGKQLLMKETLRIEDVAKSVGMTQEDFESVFQIATNESPQEYRRRIFSDKDYPRLQKMLDLLGNTKMPEAGIAAECGFASQEEFKNHFEIAFDVSPEDYRTEMELDRCAAQLRGASGGQKLKGNDRTAPGTVFNPGQVDNNAIAEEAKSYLLGTDYGLKHIAEDLGLKDAHELNNIFRAATGMTAVTFRTQARDLNNFTLDKLINVSWEDRIETAKRFFRRIDITPEEIWKPLGYKSSYAFLSHFQQQTGESCATYYSQVSRDRFVSIEQLFMTTERSVADIAEEMGFSSSARLRKFLLARGTSPEKLKAKASPEKREDPGPK